MKALTYARYPYWFPLAALGFARLLASAVFERPRSSGLPLLTPPVHLGQEVVVATATRTGGGSVDEFWAYGLGAAFLLTIAFYALRARGGGAPIPAGRMAAVAFGGLFAIAVAAVLASVFGSKPGAPMMTTVCGPLALLGLCALVAAYFGAKRLAVPGAVLLAVSGYGALVALLPDLAAAGVICLGILVLSWIERARLLAGFAVAFLLFAAVLPKGTGSTQLTAAALLVAAMVALVAGGRPAGPVTGGD